MGRRSLLSETVMANLEKAFRMHSPIATACEFAGISPRVFYRWQERGEDEIQRMEERAEELGLPLEEVEPDEDEAMFVQFVERMTKVRSHSTVGLQALLLKHAQVDGKLALEILQRRDPDNWGRTNRLELSGTEGKPPINFYIPEEKSSD